MDFKLPYGLEYRNISLPDEQNVINIIPKKSTLKDNQLVKNALSNPLNQLPIEQELRKGEKTTIVLPSQWRSFGVLTPLMNVLTLLSSSDINAQDITILLAHSYDLPQATSTDVKELSRLAQGAEVKVFDPKDDDDVLHVGVTPSGIDVFVARRVIQAERLILINSVLPSYLTGFNGPLQLVAPGCLGSATVEQFSLSMADMERYQKTGTFGYGRLQNNPLNAELSEILKFACVDLAIALVISNNGQILNVTAGELFSVYQQGCDVAIQAYRKRISTQPELVILAAGGYPFDIDVRTAVGALASLANMELQGVTVVLIARCPQGLDHNENLSWDKFLEFLSGEDSKDFELNFHDWPLLLLKRFLLNNRLLFVSDTEIQVPEELGIRFFCTPDAALQEALSELDPDSIIWIIPHGQMTWVVL